MGAIPGCIGGYSPICNECGVLEDWEVSREEYDSDENLAKELDDWLCPTCKEYNAAQLRLKSARGNAG